MLYLLAFFIPPLAVLLAGKPFKAILNLVLTLFFWLPGFIHALIVINQDNKDKRMEEQSKLNSLENNRINEPVEEHETQITNEPVPIVPVPIAPITSQPIETPVVHNKKFNDSVDFNVTGVTYENDKGKDIQSLLRKLGKSIAAEQEIPAYGGISNREMLDVYDAVSEFEDVEFGEYVFLEKDPNNEYDKNAIKVFIEFPPGKKHHIGHVPKKINRKIGKLLDEETIDYIDANFVGGKIKEVEYDIEKDKEVVVVKELTLGVEITLNLYRNISPSISEKDLIGSSLKSTI
jgi:uncharacterized membrane protein YqaE (UPF0057 family)